MSNLEEHEAEQARITAEWEERAAPYLPAESAPDAPFWYVTVTWDNWPEGGSYGSVIRADDSDKAEAAVMWDMANCREEFDHPADAIDSYGHEWHVVDCFKLDDFIEMHKEK